MYRNTKLVEGERSTYGWNRMGRKGEACVLVILGKTMNSCQVRFDDGYEAITSANALKTYKEQEPSFFD